MGPEEQKIDNYYLGNLGVLLADIFNEMNLIEEMSLKFSSFSDVSLKEMHTIQAIGLNGSTSSSELAEKLHITMGTLTVAIRNLVKKGYVQRNRLPEDRRVVRVELTKSGRVLYRIHRKFHVNMAKGTLKDFDAEEVDTIYRGLRSLQSFLNDTRTALMTQQEGLMNE